ncbi:hypothetical protein RB12245 [Rhodopirellula baltica SH 1]|uniref:Uncharacterized protein n=1 Tax=Rhodopirellula baltica (strain DSM 10527 / NCIMB 13988 / SH1) TaxID=243090 RepID=Q7UIY8_RHOBA|nr:hypothetical protein RB12245 [Rhodopirellula baltica SH 1]
MNMVKSNVLQVVFPHATQTRSTNNLGSFENVLLQQVPPVNREFGRQVTCVGNSCDDMVVVFDNDVLPSCVCYRNEPEFGGSGIFQRDSGKRPAGLDQNCVAIRREHLHDLNDVGLIETFQLQVGFDRYALT